VAKNDNDHRCMVKRRVHTLVRRGLRKLQFNLMCSECSVNIFAEEQTGNTNLEMSWEIYEHAIVDRHHVALEGWPSTVFNPGKMSTKVLELVLNALEEGRCYWCNVSSEEVEDRLNTIATKKASGEIPT
jgi:tRNA U54 and U55 pseudouridine synthase Pus10